MVLLRSLRALQDFATVRVMCSFHAGEREVMYGNILGFLSQEKM